MTTDPQQTGCEPTALINLIEYQASLIPTPSNYEDELHTIKHLHNLPQRKRDLLRNMTQTWLEESSRSTNTTSNMKKSQVLREEGNRVFTSKSPRRDVLLACKYYTEAIFAAGNHNETLCLAFANRAMALQEFGYYQQAYDDCEYALEFGYPSCRQHKLVMRQAFCALQLGNKDLLERHLIALTQMKLNESFQKEFNNLQLGLHNLKTNLINKPPEVDAVDLNRHSQQIVTESSPKGRCMKATVDISEQSLIFNEEVTSFVPVGDPGRICQQCAAILKLIPIPCVQCHGHVVYCSRKCCQAHATVHSYECAGYRLGIFEQIGITHLAFRTVLDCLPQAIPYLQEKNTVEDLWQTLMAPNNGIEYKEPAQTWHMATHLNKMQMEDILWFALTAEFLKDYLLIYTNYFKQFETTTSSNMSWHLLLSALILRTIGQLIVNGYSSITIMPKIQQNVNFSHAVSPLLQSELWASINHVRCGRLHSLCANYRDVATLNLPYTSLCNHACIQRFRLKINGKVVSTYATTNIPAGAEITNCYTLDYRQSRCSDRRKELLSTYRFICECIKCKNQQPDKEYDSFHRYYCEYGSCRQIFVAKLPEEYSSDTCDSNPNQDCLICSSCHKPQSCNKLHQFKMLLVSPDAMMTSQNRLALFSSFDTLHTCMVNYNDAKLRLAYRLIEDCFAALDAEAVFTNEEFAELIKILKFCLKGIAAQSGIKTIEYVTQFSYLWDIIALGKYKPMRKEVQEMLTALEVVSDEFQMLYRNYYEDFIENLTK